MFVCEAVTECICLFRGRLVTGLYATLYLKVTVLKYRNEFEAYSSVLWQILVRLIEIYSSHITLSCTSFIQINLFKNHFTEGPSWIIAHRPIFWFSEAMNESSYISYIEFMLYGFYHVCTVYIYIYIYTVTYLGCVANNCGFWIKWIDLLHLHQS
jgi:hypothetical protein